MEYTENGHLDAEQHGGNANLDIRCLYCVRGFNGAGGSEKGDEKLEGSNLSAKTVKNAQGLRVLTFCQKDKKMTSLIAATLRRG